MHTLSPFKSVAALREHDVSLQVAEQEHPHLHRHKTAIRADGKACGLEVAGECNTEDATEGEEAEHRIDIHDCYAQVTFREFVIYVVTLAFFLYHRDMPLYAFSLISFIYVSAIKSAYEKFSCKIFHW